MDQVNNRNNQQNVGVQPGNQADEPESKFVKFIRIFFMKKYRRTLSIKETILLFAFFGVLFIIIGIIVASFNARIVEQKVRYDSKCEQINTQANWNITNCNITIVPEKTLEPPIFFFYNLENFYQNHRRYMKSKSDPQLNGQVISLKDAQSACDPIVLNKDLAFSNNVSPYNNKVLNPDEIANPCGLIAKSFFNDKYEIYAPNGTQIAIDDTDISWPDDKGDKFKQNTNPNITQWINPENEHFIVWMRTAGLPNFRKLWGRIKDVSLEEGKTYTIKIANNYDVSPFNGKKNVVVSTSGPLGGKNGFLAGACIAVGVFCILIAAFFFYKYRSTGGAFGNKIE